MARPMGAQNTPPLDHVVSLLSEAISEGGDVRAEGDDRIRVIVRSGRDVRLRVRTWASGEQASKRGRTLWVLRAAHREVLEELRRRDESFVDLRGVVRLHVPGLFVDREDLRGSTRALSSQVTRSPFADKSSLVPRTLFSHGEERRWTVSSLAQAAGVAPSTASYAVRALAEREILEVHREWRKKFLRLVDRRALVKEWAREYSWRRNVQVPFQAPVGSPSRFLPRLPRLMPELRWALTLQAGASLLAPHATWERIHLYANLRSPQAALDLGVELGWKPEERGPLVLMVPHHRSSVWFGLRRADGLPVVSDLQLILDLWHYPLRGREQAEHLLARVQED